MTVSDDDPSRRWTIEEAAEHVTANGGRGIPVPLDHTDDEGVAALFERIERTHARLDVLVNNVWQWGPGDTYVHPTWEQPPERWDAMMVSASGLSSWRHASLCRS